MADERINPAVANTIADMDGERIAERSTLDYPRNFWSSLKNGHYRGALVGAGYLGTIGGIVGLAVCATIGTFSLPILAAFVGGGALMGVDGFGSTGAAAASRAAGLAEKHARILDADARGKGMIAATDDKLMYNGKGQHYEFPKDRDHGKLYNWKSGIMGSLLGMASGAVLGLAAVKTGVLEIGAIAATKGALATAIPALAAASPLVLAAAAGAVVFGALGLYFGLERRVLKSVMNQTDANINGNVKFKDGPDLGRAQSLESNSDLEKHRLLRQEEIRRLEKEYNDRIFWGGITGRFRGFPGIVVGLAAGAALGAAVVALTVTGGFAAAAAIPIMAAFTTGGGLLAMNGFSESGMEAGAEATARAIDNEFERNRALRAQGITPPAPKEAKITWAVPKAAITAGVLGAAAGAALTPLLGGLVLGMAQIPIAGHGLMALGVSSLIGGLTGATYGIGNKAFRASAKPLMKVYDTFSSQPEDPGLDYARRSQLPPAPVVNSQISPEEAALLNERLNAGNGKTFTQMTQQLLPAPPILRV